MEIISGPTLRKARLYHVCDFCGCVIIQGEKYYQSTNVANRELYTWKSHTKCMELVSYLEMEGNEGVTMEDFYEYVTDKFKNLWSEIDNKLYESKDFVIPDFNKQVNFVYEKVCGPAKNI